MWKLLVEPREAGSGRTAFKNCNGTICFPSNSIGSILVIPTFSRHREFPSYLSTIGILYLGMIYIIELLM